ncbi:MAG TPA: hypothetical protein VIT19_03615, partial [Pyrinomonadaceae bacterium]
MFACIYSRTAKSPENIVKASVLTDLAFSFSPLIEQTSDDTVVLDVSGQDLLFGEAESPVPSPTDLGSARNVADEIVRRGEQLNLKIQVAVAANPDAA